MSTSDHSNSEVLSFTVHSLGLEDRQAAECLEIFNWNQTFENRTPNDKLESPGNLAYDRVARDEMKIQT